MQLLIMQFSQTTCHFIPLRSKYSPKHPVALGGLVVNVLVTGPKVAVSNPAEDDGF
jgi:hypothetical protein